MKLSFTAGTELCPPGSKASGCCSAELWDKVEFPPEPLSLFSARWTSSMSVPQGWEHDFLLQQQQIRKVANVSPAFGGNSSASCSSQWGPHPVFFFLTGVGPEGASLVSHRRSEFPLGRAACTPHPPGTASPLSLFLLALRWAQPQDPGLCWSCAVTLSQDPGWQVSLGVLSVTVTAKHLQMQPCSSTWVLLGLCRAAQLWDVGNVGQRMLGNTWKIWLVIQLKTSLLTSGVGPGGLQRSFPTQTIP